MKHLTTCLLITLASLSVLNATVRFGEYTNVGEGAILTELPAGEYGEFEVKDGFLQPAKTPLTVGSTVIGRGTSNETEVIVFDKGRTVRTSDELRGAMDNKHAEYRSGTIIEMRGPIAGGEFIGLRDRDFHGSFKNLEETCVLRSADVADQAVLNLFAMGDAVVDPEADYGNVLCEDFIVYQASPKQAPGERQFQELVAGMTLIQIGIKAPMKNVTLRRITARSNNINWRLDPGTTNFAWKINGFKIASTAGPDANIVLEDCRSEQMLGIGLTTVSEGGITSKRFVHVHGFDDMYRVTGNSRGDSENIRLLGGLWLEPWTNHFYHPDMVHTFYDHYSSPYDIKKVEIAFTVVVLGVDGMLAPTTPTSRITAQAMFRLPPDSADTDVAYEEGNLYLGDTRENDITYTLPDLSKIDFPQNWKIADAVSGGKELKVIPGEGTFDVDDKFTLTTTRRQTRLYTITGIDGDVWTLNYPLLKYEAGTPIELRIAVGIQKIMDGSGRLRVQTSGNDTLVNDLNELSAPDTYDYVEPWETWRFDSIPAENRWKMGSSGAPYQGVFANPPKPTAKEYGQQRDWDVHHNIVLVTAPSGYRFGGRGGVFPENHAVSSNVFLTLWPGNLNGKNTPNSMFQGFGPNNQRNARIDMDGDGHAFRGNITSYLTINDQRDFAGNHVLGLGYRYEDLQELFDLSAMDQESKQFFAASRKEIIEMVRPKAKGLIAGKGMGPGLGVDPQNDCVDWELGEFKSTTPWHVLSLEMTQEDENSIITWQPPAYTHLDAQFRALPVLEYQIEYDLGNNNWVKAPGYDGQSLSYQTPSGNNEAMRLRIRGRNANGWGHWLVATLNSSKA